jgi:hypothetical protein
MIKKECTRNKYGLLPPKIAESDIVTLVYSLCESGESTYNKNTIKNNLCLLFVLTMIDPDIQNSLFRMVKPIGTSIQDLFHKTWLARYPQSQIIVFDNGIMGKFKRDFKQICKKTIMALKPNQLQVTATIYKQMQSLNEYTKLWAVNHILRSFDFKTIIKI